MKETIKIQVEAPQYSVVTGTTFAQVDAWFGHTRKDLKMDIIYPEDQERLYPCIVWICGGAWVTMDRSAHLAYLAGLARSGFVVASVEYRTSNEAVFPAQLVDIKSAIRYLRAHSDRFRINPEQFGVMGESAGGHLTAMAALRTIQESIRNIPARWRLPAHGIRRQMFPVFPMNLLQMRRLHRNPLCLEEMLCSAKRKRWRPVLLHMCRRMLRRL